MQNNKKSLIKYNNRQAERGNMKLKLKHLSVFFLVFCLLTGCGKVQTNNNGSASSGITSEKKEPSSSESKKSNEAFLKQEEEAEPTPVPKKAEISLKEHYSDSNRYVTVLGLEEYKKLKGDFGTDTPGKGNIFLVLFLEIENSSKEKTYINPYEVAAKADDKELENTVLVNQPEGYPTIFTNIEPDMSQKGFIVWEVPKKWKKFEFTYTGWEGSDGLTLDASFSKKDLKTPKKY